MSARNGKIARLPRRIRDELNHKLEDGEDGREILDWLNGLYDVKEILRDRFRSQPVNKQNLSDWRHGGFRDWQRRHESNAFLRGMIDHSDELDDLAGDESLADRAARLVVAELLRLLHQLQDEELDSKERLRLIVEIQRAVSTLRHGNQKAALLHMEKEYFDIDCQEWWEAQWEKDRKEYKRKVHDIVMKPFKIKAMAEAFGGGELGRKLAEIYCGDENDPIPHIPTPQAEKRDENSAPVKPGQGESSPVRPEGPSDTPPDSSSKDPTADEADA